MKPPPRTGRVVLDRIDLSILEALRENARITYQALSERVGLSPRPCLERVKRLEQKGVIRGYAALIEPRPSATTSSLLRASPCAIPRPPRGSVWNGRSAPIPSVVELQVVNGENDYVARIVAPTLAVLRGFDRGLPGRSGFRDRPHPHDVRAQDPQEFRRRILSATARIDATRFRDSRLAGAGGRIQPPTGLANR